MKKLIFLLFIHLIVTSSVNASDSRPEKWSLNLEQCVGSVEFYAIGRPSALKIHGVGVAPKGTLSIEETNLSGVIGFSLDSLDTGIKLRNEHMKKKYLETQKFPEAKLTLSKLRLPDRLKQESAKIEKLNFEGILSLHGVENRIEGLVDVSKNGNQVQVSANFKIKISDFSIPTPGFAGITVADVVEVKVQFSGPYTIKD